MDKVEGRGSNAKKRQPGRPKKTIKRSEILVVRLTLSELLMIKGKAKLAGTTASEWFRQAARKAKIAPRLSVEEMGRLRSLSGLANNLNQLTKLAHTAGLVSLSSECRKLMERTGSLMDKLLEDGG